MWSMEQHKGCNVAYLVLVDALVRKLLNALQFDVSYNCFWSKLQDKIVVELRNRVQQYI